MKRIQMPALLVFILTASLVFAQEQLGRITFPLGENYLQKKGTVNWEPVKIEMPVNEKDKIRTGKESRCEITFRNKKVLRIGENSIVRITRNQMGKEEVEMSKGMAWISLFLPKGLSDLLVRTPTSVCAVRGTVYRLESDSNATTYRCYEGELAIQPLTKDRQNTIDSTIIVGAGEELILTMNFEEYKRQQQKEFEEFQQKETEEFEQFMEQDRREFEEMVEKDWREFKQMENGPAFRKSTFNVQADTTSDWVKWNQERDRLLREQ